MGNKPVIRVLYRAENILATILLLSAATFPIIEIFTRLVFKTGIRSASEYVQHLVVWITFIGGMITSREGKHLSLSVGITLIRQPYRQWIESAVACISTAVAAVFTFNAFSFMQIGFDQTRTIGFIPIKLVIGIIPAGFAIITVRFIIHTPGGISKKIIAALGIGVAYLFSLIQPEQTGMLLWPCFTLLVVTAFFGTPIFIVLGGIAALFFQSSGGTVITIPSEAYTMLTGWEIPTIPLFTLTGFILSESKAGERLIKFFQAAFGWLPGGLAVMATVVCAFFTTFTGASGVTILALGGLLSYILMNSRYPKSFTTGLLTASGSIGLLFPPSLPIILYGVVAQINIKKMFVGGILPGVLLVSAIAILGVASGLKNKVERTPFNLKETLIALRNCLWEILLPVVALFCFFKGYTKLVETGALTVLYALVTQVFIRRDFKIRDLPDVFLKGVPIIGGVLIILAVAKGLSYYIVDAEIPMHLSAWCSAHISSKYVFLILLNIALLITGCLMDIFSATMVMVPLIIPLGEAYGIHPVHLGIIFLANLEVGYLTPPVGLNLFLASFRFNEPLTKVYKDVIPFLIVMIITVLAITYIPWMSTALLEVWKF